MAEAELYDSCTIRIEPLKAKYTGVRCEDRKCKGRIVMEKILLKCQLTQHMDHANSKQRYKIGDVNKKKQCSNFWLNVWSNFRPFSTKLDHFRRNYNSTMWFFRRNGFRQCGSFDKMALDDVFLDEVSRILFIEHCALIRKTL